MRHVHQAEEDYLKLIYELSVEQNREKIKTNEISESFGYTDQSVNEMIKKLVNKKFLLYQPYKGVSLTKKGKKEAMRMIRAHRIWEVFLTQKLNISWQDVHIDAEKLEHASSPELIEKLYQYLDEPKYCQHGNPIPTIDGVSEKIETMSLWDANETDLFTIKRVLDHKELLAYLDDKKIELNMTVQIIKKDHFNGYITILYDHQESQITERVAKMLFGIKK